MADFFETDFSVIFNKNIRISDELFIYEVGFENCKPTKDIEYIPIDFYLIHYCTKGTGILKIGEKETKITKGDLFLIPPKTQNKYKPVKEDPWSYCWIGINGIIAKKVLENCGFNKENFILKNINQDILIGYFKNIYESCYVNNHFKAIGNLYLLIDHLNEINSKPNIIDLTSKDIYLKNILYYIHENYYKEIKISEISSTMNIDRTYIYKLFKKYLNISPQQYILNYRLEKSTVLLRKSNLSITEISEKMGFNTYSYFVKKFKVYTGVSPLEYRNKLK